MCDNHRSDQESTHSHPNEAFISKVDRQSIIDIALSVRRQSLPPHHEISCTVDSCVSMGSFNAVWFIDFDDGTQWIFRTSFTDWSPAQEQRLLSDIRGVQLIQSKTTIPIPRIINFSASQDNRFGRPYVIMERVTGVPLHERWFDPTWFSEEKRRTIFSSLVSIMSQLETIEFAQIGSIYCNEGEYTVGPLIPSSMAIDNEITDIRGPYNTVHSFLMDTIAHSGVSERIKASFRLLAGSIPDERLDGPPFVLSMPDYDAQNVYIDDEGNVTGLIDWDDIVVGPRQAGFSRYPLWIMRDIEPDGNGFEFQTPVWKNLPFPPREEIQQDWPDVMPGYRAEFVDVLKEVNSTAVVNCTRSHLVTALIHEISAVFHFGRIQDNLSDYMFLVDDGSPKFLDAYTFELGFERGEWMKHYFNPYEKKT